MANTVSIQITTINHTGPGFAQVIASTQLLTLHMNQAGSSTDRTNNILGRLHSTVTAVASKFVAGVRSVGTFTSAVLAAGQASIIFSKALVNVGAAAARLAPLISFLPALAAGAALAINTLKLAGPGLVRAFEPITRMFFDAKGEAAAFTKELRRVVAIDVGPAAAAFAKLNMPAIQEAMERIAYQTNLVVAGFMNWTNSLRGIETVKSISTATADAFTRLAPHVIKTSMAIADLAGRAADPAFKIFSNTIAAILDRLRAWANNSSVEDINGALKDLSGYGQKLKDTFTVIRDVGRWMSENQEKVKTFAAVVASATLAIGIATGNIPAILAGAASLIANYWDEIKESFKGALPLVQELKEKWENDIGRIQITEGIMHALEDLKKGFQETTGSIGPQWQEFVSSLKDAWKTWAPIIAVWWDTIGSATFRMIGQALGTFLSNAMTVSIGVAKAFDFIGEAINLVLQALLNMVGITINAMAHAFGWIPELGPKLKKAAAEFNDFAKSVNAALNSIKDHDVYVRTHFVGGQGQSRGGEYRSGGIKGAATGGPQNGMTLVGEEGPELVRLPTGSMVYPRSNTNQMMSGGGGGQPVQIIFGSDGGDFPRAVVGLIATYVKANGGRPELLGLKR